MSPSRKLLLYGGLGLVIWGMSYGLWYALFGEHQALEAMGVELASGFADAAQGKIAEAHSAVAEYGRIKFNYVRQVDVHSHWGGLAMMLIALAVTFDGVAFDERKRYFLALILVAGSALFPLGVILQTATSGFFPSALAITGAVLVIVGLALAAWGFARG